MFPFWMNGMALLRFSKKWQRGSLGLGDFYAQHNEHRIFFPRLIFFALARLTHWDIRAELWVIFLLTLVCLFNISQIAQRGVAFQNKQSGTPRPDPIPMREARSSSPDTFWLLFAASFLLFNPQNVANFLWGFQVGFLLPLACVTACIWTATYPRYPSNFLAAIAFLLW